MGLALNGWAQSASKTATDTKSATNKTTTKTADPKSTKKKTVTLIKRTTLVKPANGKTTSPTATGGKAQEAGDSTQTATVTTDESPAKTDPAANVTPGPASMPAGGYLCNPPLPYMPLKLDILFIGNSFSIDTSTALPEIFNSIGISNVTVYVLYKGGCSMKQHYEYYKSGEAVYELWQYNIYGGKKIVPACSIRDVMRREPYDIVVFQQYSLESGDYSTYEPYLGKLIQAYNITKLSPRTTFAFNQTWAYASKNKNIGRYGSQQAMYRKICDSVRKMKAASGIDIVIPCGTAVQNARATAGLWADNELTRDTQHIDLYMGRYLLACTFFEAIIAPCMGRNIRNDITIYGNFTYFDLERNAFRCCSYETITKVC